MAVGYAKQLGAENHQESWRSDPVTRCHLPSRIGCFMTCLHRWNLPNTEQNQWHRPLETFKKHRLHDLANHLHFFRFRMFNPWEFPAYISKTPRKARLSDIHPLARLSCMTHYIILHHMSIWRLIKIPLSVNDHSSQIKKLSRIFREPHGYPSRRSHDRVCR